MITIVPTAVYNKDDGVLLTLEFTLSPKNGPYFWQDWISHDFVMSDGETATFTRRATKNIASKIVRNVIRNYVAQIREQVDLSTLLSLSEGQQIKTRRPLPYRPLFSDRTTTSTGNLENVSNREWAQIQPPPLPAGIVVGQAGGVIFDDLPVRNQEWYVPAQRYQQAILPDVDPEDFNPEPEEQIEEAEDDHP